MRQRPYGRVYTFQPCTCMTLLLEFIVKCPLIPLCLVFLILASIGFTQSNLASSSTRKALSIESIFADGSLTGRAPETLKWSPDGKMLSYVQRDDSGDHGELWYVDASTGEKKVLVSEAKLAMLAPSADKIKDEREKERVTRYHVAAYNWWRVDPNFAGDRINRRLIELGL